MFLKNKYFTNFQISISRFSVCGIHKTHVWGLVFAFSIILSTTCCNKYWSFLAARDQLGGSEAGHLNPEIQQSPSTPLPLAHLIQLHLKNHCSKTAGTRLPVSLRYRLNNKNRLALKRCSKTAKKEVFAFETGRGAGGWAGGGVSFDFGTISCLSCHSILESQTPPGLWDFETMLSRSHHCSFG